MKSMLKGAALALAFAGTTLTAQAANVTLTGWAFGSGNSVAATGTVPYSGQAGGFIGSLSGAPGFDANPFITYCIELTEHFSFSSTAMTGYAVVAGSNYFQTRYGNASKAETLGKLMTYAYDVATRVDSAAESTSLQLAIWNIVYDSDFSVTSPGSFRDNSSYKTYADTLLAGVASVSESRFNVFALERSGKQDFLLLAPRLTPVDQTSPIPEPASLALVMVAFGAAGAAGATARRRKLSAAAA